MTKNKDSHNTWYTLSEKMQSIAYKVIGDKTEGLMPFFKNLRQILESASIKIGFKMYVSTTIFFSLIMSFLMFAIVPLLLIFVFQTSLLFAALSGLGASLFTFVFSILGFYLYPVYRADKLRRELEDELAFTSGYMAILASAGVSPEKIFYALSSLQVPLAASTEAKNIIYDINLFGLDIISALKRASKRTPSKIFQELIEGLISTIHSGSSLSAYLRQKNRQYIKLKRISLSKFSNTLSILSEVYVTLLVTAPLLLVIMLVVMTMMGGGNIGPLGPDILLNLLTYVGIPFASIAFLIILDAISPKW
ncbi:type II secretion system F family protein [Candidatus Bathyarchaeota archaeon]|nr:type II secretion system F family protein [Candidatus Bathyarchaeota archaeon]